MSAQPSASYDAGVPSAGRTISLVSPHDEEIAIGPILPDDLGILFAWLMMRQPLEVTSHIVRWIA